MCDGRYTVPSKRLWKEPVMLCGKLNVRHATSSQVFTVTTFCMDARFFFATHQSHRPPCRAGIQPMSHKPLPQLVRIAEWHRSLVAKALDSQLGGCEFNSRPRRCRVTTLGKLFTPTCLSRSQWFSDGMIDYGVRGRGRLCLPRQPLRCTALGTGCAPFLQCLGRLSLPPSVGR